MFYKLKVGFLFQLKQNFNHKPCIIVCSIFTMAEACKNCAYLFIYLADFGSSDKEIWATARHTAD